MADDIYAYAVVDRSQRRDHSVPEKAIDVIPEYIKLENCTVCPTGRQPNTSSSVTNTQYTDTTFTGDQETVVSTTVSEKTDDFDVKKKKNVVVASTL